jgi:hypothetical protein
VATANTILLARKSRRAVRRAAQGSIEEARKDRLGVLFFFRPQTSEKCRDRVIRKVIGGTESEQQNATSD